MTAMRTTWPGRPTHSSFARSGVTSRGDSANTKPSASAPARTAAATASGLLMPQIFTNMSATSRAVAVRPAAINAVSAAAGSKARISDEPTSASR